MTSAELTEMRDLSPDVQRTVTELAAAATEVDGVAPLDDQVRSEIRYGASETSTHVLARVDGSGDVVGYAHAAHDSAGLSGHLVVHPEHRRRGIGAALLDDLIGALSHTGVTSPTLRVWAHGDTPGARGLAAARRLWRSRELIQMRRALDRSLPTASYPNDVQVRAFVPGQDEDAWVALNARAFASHPEQGRLTRLDLEHRMAEPWFDPAGFFLAERDGRLLGSHWTKTHPASETGAEPPIGEVYAVGVDPDARGLGLGKALTLTGLHHLHAQGLDDVMLYVDGENTAAVALYERLGFTTSRVDVMYATSAAPAP